MNAHRVVVVGIGADGMAGLSPTSAAELRSATTIYGSRRQLDLLDGTVRAERREWPTPLIPALHALRDDPPGDVHIVASGDPMLHGIGGSAVRMFGADRVTVLPHVSSVTLACARLGWAVQDTEVVSLVTAAPRLAVRRGGRAVVLSRDETTPSALARVLTDTGRGDSAFTVFEQLGGPGSAAATPPRGHGRPSHPATSTRSTSSPSSTCPTSGSSRYCLTTHTPTTDRSPSRRCVR